MSLAAASGILSAPSRSNSSPKLGPGERRGREAERGAERALQPRRGCPGDARGAGARRGARRASPRSARRAAWDRRLPRPPPAAREPRREALARAPRPAQACPHRPAAFPDPTPGLHHPFPKIAGVRRPLEFPDCEMPPRRSIPGPAAQRSPGTLTARSPPGCTFHSAPGTDPRTCCSTLSPLSSWVYRCVAMSPIILEMWVPAPPALRPAPSALGAGLPGSSVASCPAR